MYIIAYTSSLMLLALSATFGQVVNNNIQNRSALILDEDPTFSVTDHATVEWACINKALTNKCLVYHNDQWFRFNVQASGRYYLNIKLQQCRDSRGVQVIVIEGNPCEIKAYKILKCIPQIRRTDSFVTLDSIKAGIDYLINIDGFLGDFCSFGIQLSTQPRGVVHDAESLDTIKLSATLRDTTVTLRWTIDQALADELEEFEIYRKRHGMALDFIGKVSVERNSIGVAKTQYSFSDILKIEGIYTYEIHGDFKDGLKEILGNDTIKWESEALVNAKTIQVSLKYKNGTELQMLLIDKMQEQVLKQTTFKFDRNRDRNQLIDVSNYLRLGINHFVVRMINSETHEKEDHEFVLKDN